jgi:hypothetical protein
MGQSGSRRRKPVGRRTPPSRRGTSRSSANYTIVVIYLATIFALGAIGISFFSGNLVIGGVPSSIILQFLQDEVARNAYFSGDATKLHDRMDEMGIEEQIKAYYRPQIPNEDQLDRYIHQILYDRTGYVGVAYRVGGNGRLVPKE